MTGLVTERIALPTGVTLNVRHGGPADAPGVIFLHGFPESYRTWRHQLDALSRTHRVAAPDQRGFGASDRPDGVEAYRTVEAIGDLIALADALGMARFTLVGHDWGGAVAWAAALRHPDRIERLAIVNAPHPLIFQKSLVEDEAQRAASQYMTAFRDPAMEARIEAMGLAAFFDRSFAGHVDLPSIPAEERDATLHDWRRPGALTAMLNWYRASAILVPAPGEAAALPDWTTAPFPVLAMPVLVVWGLKDKALLPVQLAGLERVIADLRLVVEPDAGHFVTWERPETVTAALADFLAETDPPTA